MAQKLTAAGRISPPLVFWLTRKKKLGKFEMVVEVVKHSERGKSPAPTRLPPKSHSILGEVQEGEHVVQVSLPPA
jgi:hypothetical protein